MARLIYLFGAGASAADNLIINADEFNDDNLDDFSKPRLSGIPLISNFGNDLKNFLDIISKNENIEEGLFDYYRSLYMKLNGSFSFDTYARSLFIKKMFSDLEDLKFLLNYYLVFRELISNIDKRYELFLASIITNAGTIPNDYLFLSYNYDVQFERAISNFSKNKDVQTLINRATSNNLLPNGYLPTLLKLNGSSIIFKKNNDKIHIDENFHNDRHEKIEIEHFSSFLSEQQQMYYKNLTTNEILVKNGIRFSWELENGIDLENNTYNLFEAETLIVIGYSFPTVNRENDIYLFNKMPHLKSIFVQVGDGFGMVETRLKYMIFPKINWLSKPDIIEINNVDQFFVL